MLAYIDAGTAAAVAAMVTGGAAGMKAAAQSMFMRRKSKGTGVASTSEPAEQSAAEASAPVGADA